MNFKFFTTSDFDKSFKRLSKKYPSLPDDLKEFEEEYRQNPTMGIDLGGGIRKVRIAITSKAKGKSGGARVITFNAFISEEKNNIVLVNIYDKSEHETMSVGSIKALLREVGLL